MSELQILASCSGKLEDTNWLHDFAFHAKNNQSMILFYWKIIKMVTVNNSFILWLRMSL